MSAGAEQTFSRELESLLNYHSQENKSNTPDFILAKYLLACLDAYGAAVTERDKWYHGIPNPAVQAWDAELAEARTSDETQVPK